MFWNNRNKKSEELTRAKLIPPPPPRAVRGWCIDNKCTNCSDYSDKCHECGNNRRNHKEPRVSHFIPVERVNR